jgi:hypothetical protein
MQIKTNPGPRKKYCRETAHGKPALRTRLNLMKMSSERAVGVAMGILAKKKNLRRMSLSLLLRVESSAVYDLDVCPQPVYPFFVLLPWARKQPPITLLGTLQLERLHSRVIWQGVPGVNLKIAKGGGAVRFSSMTKQSFESRRGPSTQP